MTPRKRGNLVDRVPLIASTASSSLKTIEQYPTKSLDPCVPFRSRFTLPLCYFRARNKIIFQPRRKPPFELSRTPAVEAQPSRTEAESSPFYHLPSLSPLTQSQQPVLFCRSPFPMTYVRACVRACTLLSILYAMPPRPASCVLPLSLSSLPPFFLPFFSPLGHRVSKGREDLAQRYVRPVDPRSPKIFRSPRATLRIPPRFLLLRAYQGSRRAVEILSIRNYEGRRPDARRATWITTL